MEIEKLETAVKEEIARFKEGTEKLFSVLIERCLFQEYDSRTAHLFEELKIIASERDTLAQGYEQAKAISDAKVSVLKREAEEFLAKGNLAGEKKKLEEAEKVEGQSQALREKILALDGRTDSISNEIENIARKLFLEEVFPMLKNAIPTLNATMAAFQQSIREGLIRFEGETGTGTSGLSVVDDGLVKRPILETLGL
ncbi:MAG: hypothetical protein ACLQGU_19725 [bacterium]